MEAKSVGLLTLGAASVGFVLGVFSGSWSRRSIRQGPRRSRSEGPAENVNMSVGPGCRDQLEQLGAKRSRALNDLMEVAADDGFRSSELARWTEMPDACLGGYTDEEFELDVWNAAVEDGLEASHVFKVFKEHGLEMSDGLWRAAQGHFRDKT